ncbi:MAG TPA: hypothetical protein DCL21_00260 [Alphaproteobacteria bacterium]|nr:hypothetical protein [Alphaproteobacteria bacterium]
MKHFAVWLLLIFSLDVFAVNLNWETTNFFITSESPQTFRTKDDESFSAHIENRVIYSNGVDGSFSYIYKLDRSIEYDLDVNKETFNLIVKQEFITHYLRQSFYNKSKEQREDLIKNAKKAIDFRVKKEILRGRNIDYISLNFIIFSKDLRGLEPDKVRVEPKYDYYDYYDIDIFE